MSRKWKYNDEHLVEKLSNKEYVFWVNPNLQNKFTEANGIPLEQLKLAESRWDRFAQYFKLVYPETRFTNGIIESEIVEIDEMKNLIEGRRGIHIPGRLFLKCDHALPISGSIKARGGVYEVMKFAEKLAFEHGLLEEGESYEKLASNEAKKLFSTYKIIVGSTGKIGRAHV